MTTVTAPAPAPTVSPLEAARAELQSRLAVRATTAGLPAPAVSRIGDANVLGQPADRPVPTATDTAPPDPRAVPTGTDALQPDTQAATRGTTSDGPRPVPPHTAVVHLTAQAVLLGPWGGAPDAGPACGTCLAMRRQRLRTRTEREALETGTETTAAGPWPVLPDHTVDAVWSLHRHITSGAARHTTEGADTALPRITELDLETLQVRTFPLVPEPMCPHCRPFTEESARQAATEATLGKPASRRKPGGPDAYRLRRPADYPLPVKALANPVCGVLGGGTWIDVTSPTTAPVAGSVFMRGYAGLTDVTWSGQANSYASSRDLAFLEGLERYAGTHRRHRAPVVTASLDELGDRALDPRVCGLYGPRTYAQDPMVEPFDPARPLPWVTGWSLREDRPVLVPARLVYYSAGTREDNFVFECSNGCATGGSWEEAAFFGLLELVERDAFLLGWYGGLPLPEIDLASVGGPKVRAMVARAALQGYDVHVFDNRVDLPVPVVTGLAVRSDEGPGTLAFAAGASFDPETAVESAVSEILTYIPHLPGQVAERPAELAAMTEDFDLVRRLPDHAALFGLPAMRRHAANYLAPPRVGSLTGLFAGWEERGPRTGDLRDDLLLLRDLLAGAGCDVIAVDQTTPEQRRMGLRTVATLAPGLLPIDFGWLRQRALDMPRLRTAPHRAGLVPAPLREEDLRRVPHPFP
ncbi:TOMM precursor leader peptide-binding protein [Streptomyces fagopyri]|uniref:TOMM leader peptide-binding protein n=1 Tax=Streptomyces fagopyri TaxID=2662397 RepID=A0A5Q0LMY5_9ACTN|nr:TOMM precursor leader peptide-binding protein [Streptomyces fagopyri]QFZ77787.1 TOMM precursor leader peptide-binding protein [Streptomyces fagopyri]